jgi:hypothetical protein
MSSTRTYRHNDTDGNFVRWMTEETIDKTTSHSRPSTEAEALAAEAAEQREARMAAYAAKLAEGADAEDEPAKAGKKAK